MVASRYFATDDVAVSGEAVVARVGIGVPVYNGGMLLAESLECLRTQTFDDFEVVLGDNASDDETSEICADYAARDPRFIHLRRPENIGSLGNFQSLRRESRAELFCWRAHDDLSDPDFLEQLVAVFDADPSVRLAVAKVRTEDEAEVAPILTEYRPPPDDSRLARIRQQFVCSHATWIYGLWHRETLARLEDRVHRDYPHEWGWDHLTILPLILDGAIAGTNRTQFIQRIFREQRNAKKRLAADASASEAREAKHARIAKKRGIRKDFDRVARAIVLERSWSLRERAVLGPLMSSYVDRCSYSSWKLWRSALRTRMGIV